MTQATRPDRSPGVGEHACLVVRSDRDREHAVTDFVRLGIEAGERVWYFADAPATDAVELVLGHAGLDVPRLVADRQLQIITTPEAGPESGPVQPEDLATSLRTGIESALADGCAGFRVTGEMGWHLGRLPTPGRLLEYETLVGPVFSGRPARGLCQYDLRRMDPATVPAYVSVHADVTGAAPEYADDILRIAPLQGAVGLRIEGEADLSNREVVQRAVEPLLEHGGDVRLDLSGLRFLDITVATTIVLGAVRLAAGRRVVIEGAPRTLRWMVSVRAWGPLPESLEVH